MKTHPNFKTANPKISNVDAIYDYIGKAFSNQNRYIKTTTPWEEKHWNKRELQNFEINLDDIDRLYYIDYYSDYRMDYDLARYRLVVRIEYNGRGCCSNGSNGTLNQNHQDHVYVELIAGYDNHYPPERKFTRAEHVIFVSRDASLFMSLVLRNPKDPIYEFLAEDGIIIDQQQKEYDVNSTFFWKNPPSLKYFCHSTVYVNKNLLNDYYQKVLPKMLSNSVEYFIRLREAKQYYSRLRYLGYY